MDLLLILEDLRAGSLNLLYQNIPLIGQYAEMLLSCAKQKKKLNEKELRNLELLLRIGNIIYNQTDCQISPIEDGVYDVLLEYYKTYNPNFQVGSEVIDFPSTENMKAPVMDLHNPIHFLTDEEIKKHNEKDFFYERLKPKASYDMRDAFYHCPVKFTDTIEHRTHNTEHNHPQLVGTLDKCKFVLSIDAEKKGVINDTNVKVLERDFFADHIRRGIIKPDEELEMIVELKYDGISVEADCTNMVVSARTRGDTGIGLASDISPMLQGYVFPHSNEVFDEVKRPIGVKFEAIMQKGDLAMYNHLRNKNYANCRTAIIGLFGASDASLFRDLITLVPLEIDRDDLPDIEWNRGIEIEFLNKYYASKGCPLRWAVIKGTYRECLYYIKRFQIEAEAARDYLDFMYDGIVVSYTNEFIRKKLGRVNHINKYSMAVKFNPLKKQTILTAVEFTVGQNGVITPMYHYNPVEFFGAIHMKTTGNSYSRFKELNLALGDIVEIEYVNDVIPRISAVDCEANRINHQRNKPVPFIRYCPICGTELVETEAGGSVMCPNPDCPGRCTSRMVNMLAKLNIKDFSDASIQALQVYNFTDLLNLKYDDVRYTLGEVNGRKFIDRITTLKTQPIPDYVIMGSLGFSGIGSKKWKQILDRYTLSEFYNLYLNGQLFELYKLENVGRGMINTINNEMRYFERDILTILNMSNIVNSKGTKTGPSIRATGFRDHILFEKLRMLGYDADDNGSVTRTTDILLIPYAGFTSKKTQKANPNTKIIPKADFIRDYNIQ